MKLLYVAVLLTVSCGTAGSDGTNGTDEQKVDAPGAEQQESGSTSPSKSGSNTTENKSTQLGGPKGLPPGTYDLRPNTISTQGGNLTALAKRIVDELKVQPRAYYSLSPWIGYSWMPDNCWHALAADIADAAERKSIGKSRPKITIAKITVEPGSKSLLVSGKLAIVDPDSTTIQLVFAVERKHCDFSFPDSN